jgi:hypothetical protein
VINAPSILERIMLMRKLNSDSSPQDELIEALEDRLRDDRRCIVTAVKRIPSKEYPFSNQPQQYLLTTGTEVLQTLAALGPLRPSEIRDILLKDNRPDKNKQRRHTSEEHIVRSIAHMHYWGFCVHEGPQYLHAKYPINNRPVAINRTGKNFILKW